MGGSWRIQAVPVSPNSFDSRKKLPEAWCGLRDSVLSDKVNIRWSRFHAHTVPTLPINMIVIIIYFFMGNSLYDVIYFFVTQYSSDCLVVFLYMRRVLSAGT